MVLYFTTGTCFSFIMKLSSGYFVKNIEENMAKKLQFFIKGMELLNLITVIWDNIIPRVAT